MAAYNQGGEPTIVCINRAKTPLGQDFVGMIDDVQTALTRDFAQVWCGAKLVVGDAPGPGQWVIIFLDTADAPGALAYHELTADGMPQAKVFVKTTRDSKDSAGNQNAVSVSFSHELWEMLIDPDINTMVDGPNTQLAYAYETADPVEETYYLVGNTKVSNFVHPAWFERFHKPKSVKFDHLGLVTKPFQLLKGGYQSVKKNGRWSEIFANKTKAKHFKQEDRRGHRSESRGTMLRRNRKKK